MEEDSYPTLEEIQRWKKEKLQSWLSSHGLPRSGAKEVLAKRVYRALGADSESSEEEEAQEYCDDLPPPEQLKEGWVIPNEGNIPPVRQQDVENYFIYRKHPGSGMKNCQRQLTKAKKLSNEDYIFNMQLHAIDSEGPLCYVKANCKPTMRQRVSFEGKVGSFYSLHISIAKTGYVNSGYCNCKAGVSGLCSHIGALLLTLSNLANPSCTSSACAWKEPKVARPPSPKRWEEINFMNTEKKAVSGMQVRPYPGVFQAGPCDDPDAFLTQILEGLSAVNPTCVLYQTMCPLSGNIDMFTTQFDNHFSYHDQVDVTSSVCQAEFRQFVNDLHICQETADQLETSTRGQNNNKNWQPVYCL